MNRILAISAIAITIAAGYGGSKVNWGSEHKNPDTITGLTCHQLIENYDYAVRNDGQPGLPSWKDWYQKIEQQHCHF